MNKNLVRLDKMQDRLERVGRIISDRYGLHLFFKEDQCCTDGKNIFLPSLPVLTETATEEEIQRYEELVCAMEGFLDHEVAHLIYTDWLCIEKCKEDPGLRMWLNALEDIRIEFKMAELWKGTGANFKASDHFAARKAAKTWDERTPLLKGLYVAIMMGKGLDDFSMFDGAAALEVESLKKTIEPLVPALQYAVKCGSTSETLALAAWVSAKAKGMDPRLGLDALKEMPKEEFDALKDFFEKLAKELLGKEKDDGLPPGVDKCEITLPGGGEGEGEGGGEMIDSRGGSEDSEHVSESVHVSWEDWSKESTGKCEKAKESEDSLDEEDKSKEGESKPFEGSGGSGLEETCISIFDVPPEEAERGIGEMERFMSGAIADGARVFRHYRTSHVEHYAPYTTAGDILNIVNLGPNSRSWFTKQRKMVRQQAGVLERKLRRRLLTQRQRGWEYDKKWGRLNTRSIPSLLLNGNDRVFKRQGQRIDVNARWMLLVDESGSMGGARIKYARQCALLFGEFCHSMGMPFEILGFSTGYVDVDRKRWSEASVEERKYYSRWGQLKTTVYKQFHEDWLRVGARLEQMDARIHNMDGESVELAARRLLASAMPGERLIMMVFSDGSPLQEIQDVQPQQEWYLKHVVDKYTRQGVELVGVGIQTDSVKYYYPSWIRVDDPAKLGEAQIEKLSELLLGGGKKKKRVA